MPPANDLPREGQTQDTHFMRAIGRAWDWRWRKVSGEFGTDRNLAIAVGLAERHDSGVRRSGRTVSQRNLRAAPTASASANCQGLAAAYAASASPF